MIVDLSKIPSTCKWAMHVSDRGRIWCKLEETLRGRVITASAYGDTAQEALDNAIEEFTR